MKKPRTTLPAMGRRRAIGVLVALSLSPTFAMAYVEQERTVEGVLERSLPEQKQVVINGERLRLHSRIPHPKHRRTHDDTSPAVGDRVRATIADGRVVQLERKP
ncbi:MULTISPECIES: hypothetical protein [unclassified Thioalkalivibrio]|uniref:hypothetical protein n=1 Tax=unclassified Thioalkalivibrio TaxID=2621013 RepID=UPI000476C7FC|nr:MULTISPECIES: hypothetical protein [unclassified Thioalkalivibrio]